MLPFCMKPSTGHFVWPLLLTTRMVWICLQEKNAWGKNNGKTEKGGNVLAESTRGRSGAQRSYAREVFSGEEIFNRAKGAPRVRRACVSARTERSWHGRQCSALWELLLFLSWLQPEVSRKLEPTFTAVQRGVHAASRGPRIPGAMPWLKLTSHKFA